MEVENVDALAVAIVSTDAMFRDALSAFLAAQSGLRVVCSLQPHMAGLKELVEAKPKVTLVDASPSHDAALQIVRQLHDDLSGVPVIVCGASDDTESTLSFIVAGASGCVGRELALGELVDHLRAVQRGEVLFPTDAIRQALRRLVALNRRCDELERPPDHLSQRESQVVRLIASGLSNKEIAHELKIEPRTVKNHVHKILSKLQLHNRVEIANFARARLRPPP